MHVLVTRPEPDALKLKGQLEARGHAASVEPLHAASYDDGEDFDLDGVTGLIVTSRHALLALEQVPELLKEARQLTVFAVGAATARTARQMGFRTVVKGPGTAADLVPAIASAVDPTDDMLLYLSGERTAIDIGAELGALGFHVTTAKVYSMEPRESLTGRTRELIGDGDLEGVLLMSGEAATVWVQLVQKHHLGTAVRLLNHFCLSDGIAKRLGPLGSIPISVAHGPTVEELLALIDAAGAQLDC